MDATYNFTLAQGTAETLAPNQLLKLQTLQEISTGMSLISLSVGFSIVGMLIIVNRHQADLSDLTGGNCTAMVGGISAMLVGAAFLVATCLHWRFCAKRSAATLGAILIGIRRPNAGCQAKVAVSPASYSQGRAISILRSIESAIALYPSSCG
jgi:hypothetical protein